MRGFFERSDSRCGNAVDQKKEALDKYDLQPVQTVFFQNKQVMTGSQTCKLSIYHYDGKDA